MGLHAKFLLFILFPGNLGQRDQAFPVFYVLFLLLLTSLFFFFFFGQSFCSRLEGSLAPYLPSMEYKNKTQETHRCPFSPVDSRQPTFFLSTLQSLLTMPFEFFLGYFVEIRNMEQRKLMIYFLS